ncbi:MAG: aminotransferase class V-fold PLP-dependent enzyme [Deltaproteobacteria bacterium]|nr:aminotransferase class V-fold PLP-dependent enzyme [Deltaproteobacteria bacterium]
MKKIYLDFNASSPVAPEVVAAMEPYLHGNFGNPSSLHWAGLPAKEALNKARGQVADLLGCSSEEIIFTSGGTECWIQLASATLRGEDLSGSFEV